MKIGQLGAPVQAHAVDAAPDLVASEAEVRQLCRVGPQLIKEVPPWPPSGLLT